jgi:hypothetical protein
MMYFRRWKGILFVVCVLFIAMSFASCEFSTEEEQAIDKIADELIEEGPAGANLTPSPTLTPTQTSTPTPTPTATPTPTPVKVSYLDEPDDVRCPYTQMVLQEMGFVDLIGYEVVLDGLNMLGTLEFADVDLGSSMQVVPFWIAGVVGGNPEVAMLPGMNPWGFGEWSVDCWYAEEEFQCAFAMRENDNFFDTDYEVDAKLEGNTLSFVLPYGFPRVGDTFGAYVQTDTGYDFLGIDENGLMLEVGFQCPFPAEGAGMVLDGSYTVCGSGCWLRDEIVEGQKEEVWCMNDSPCVARGCECHLFSRGLDDSPQDLDSWEHVAEPGQKMQKDNTQAYHCFCVQ